MIHYKEVEKYSIPFDSAIFDMMSKIDTAHNNGKISLRYYSYQKSKIQHLNNFKDYAYDQFQCFNSTINDLNRSLKSNNEILKDKIVALEAICLIHGVYDLNTWLGKGRVVLENEAVQMFKEKSFYLVEPLKNRLEFCTNSEKNLFFYVVNNDR